MTLECLPRMEVRVFSVWRHVLSGTLIAVIVSACTSKPPVVDLRASSFAWSASQPLASPRTGASSPRLKTHEVLVLTSGGADGAFGAGTLKSWTKSGKRPVFDVVSGVSVGALQAPLAFLGSDYDHVLEAVFTTTRTEDILTSNGVSGLFKSGLYSSRLLRSKLSTLIDDHFLDLVDASHNRGRRLYVTTTDLTHGRTVVWDMGAIASRQNPDRQFIFVSILLASIATPGLIEPVTIRRSENELPELHGDGGVNTPVPLQDFMIVSKAGNQRVTVIANGHISDVATTISSSRSTLPLARRAVSLLLRKMLAISSERAERLAKRSGATFRLVSLPLDVPEAVDPFAFDPFEMEMLFNRGANIGPAEWARLGR